MSFGSHAEHDAGYPAGPGEPGRAGHGADSPAGPDDGRRLGGDFGRPADPDAAAPGPADVTRLLHAYAGGDPEALDRLFPIVYGELRGIARGRMRGERDGHTLTPTALVHEAYIRLAGLNRIEWQDRGHFLAMASRVMRRVLVDHAERRRAAKRGGGRILAELPEDLPGFTPDSEIVLELDDALRRLEREHARAARALELRYFGGLNVEEVAVGLGVSLATAERDLRFGRAWLAMVWSNDGLPPDGGLPPRAGGV